MCGIVGEWRLDGRPVSREELIRARDVMRLRGPDADGLHVDGPIGLGHRRLSIIDLSPAGRMPMSNEDGTVWAVFNGEIYNFRELRAELASKGHQFRSQTDSEVILHAYEEWGPEACAKFDGMFAYAVWDGTRKRLVLARDITGEKPLYYDHRPGTTLRFASTLASLLSDPMMPRDLDPDAVRLYAAFGFVPAPRSIIRGVAKLPPASYAVFSADGGVTVTPYWDLRRATERIPEPGTLSLEAATDEVHELLRTAVRSRLISDVPLGAFLSGGVDSSLVVALMAEAKAGDVRTFTIGFKEPQYDESGYAQRVAAHLGVKNDTQVITAHDVLRELPSVTQAIDEPMADFSVLPSLAVARLARQHVTVALTGDGADEAFGGYRYYAGSRLFERIAALVPTPLRRLASRASRLAPNARLERAIDRSSSIDAAQYFGKSGFYRGSTVGEPIARTLRAGMGLHAEDTVAAFIREARHLRPTEAGMLWDATHTLPDAWLAKVDRTTMAVSLEARAPFLDRRVLERAFSLPLDHRVRGTRRKIVLQRILARYLPRELVERPKQGFTAPLKVWFANELRDELQMRLAPARLERFGVFDPSGVQGLLTEQLAGRADHTQLLWALFHLDRWAETFIHR